MNEEISGVAPENTEIRIFRYGANTYEIPASFDLSSAYQQWYTNEVIGKDGYPLFGEWLEANHGAYRVESSE